MNKKIINAIMVIYLLALSIFCVYSALGTKKLTESYEQLTTKVNKMVAQNNSIGIQNYQLSQKVQELEERIEQISAKQSELEAQNEIAMATEQVMQFNPDLKVDVDYDYDYVLRVVAAECRGESLEGQMAVVQTIRERAKQRNLTPEEVVKQPWQYAHPTSMENVNDTVREACWRVLINGESVTESPIQYFYSTKDGFYSVGHESKTYVMTIGYHKFFME